MKPTQAEILAAQTDGHEAALRGDRPGVNPHRLSDLFEQDQEHVRALQLAWIRGYQHARAEAEAQRPQGEQQP